MSQRAYLKLPKSNAALAKVINNHMDLVEPAAAFARTKWSLAWYYINGARRFKIVDQQGGKVAGFWLDEHGDMDFQSPEFLSAVDRVQGLMASLDLRPKVDRVGSSLPGMRERAAAQIIADSIISTEQLEVVKTQLTHLMTLLGCVGLQRHLVEHPTMGLSCDLEVVHPRELFPYPVLQTDYTKQGGIIRQRMVPMEVLKEKYGGKITSNKEKLKVTAMMYGSSTEAPSSDGIANLMLQSPAAMAGGDEKTKSEWVTVRELWTLGPRNTCYEYVLQSGDTIIQREDLSGVEAYCPLSVARFFETGEFYGAGMFDLVFGLSRQMELLLKSLFNDAQDVDRYGFVVLPMGNYNSRVALRDVGKGLRVLPVQPDAYGGDFKPFVVTPHSVGDMPGKVAAFAKQMLESITPVRDLAKEKGRIDSMSGLQFLDEQMLRPMTTPTRNLERVFGEVYRSAVAGACKQLVESPMPLPITRLDLSLAGVVIDPEEHTVKFTENPLPDVSRLFFTVQQTSPRSKVARKQEALELVQKGISDPSRLVLLGLKEGLDFAMWQDDHEGAYQSVVKNILILYGDGNTPGMLVTTPSLTMADLQLRVLLGFMGSPQLALASPEVQDAFMQYSDFLREQTGVAVPPGVPTPDQMANTMAGQPPVPQQQGVM